MSNEPNPYLVTVVTSADLAKHAPAAWAEQYPPRGVHKDSEFGVIRERLAALTHPTPQAVEALTGNLTWTCVTCAVCGEYARTAVRFGAAPEGVDVCVACFHRAAALLAVHTAGWDAGASPPDPPRESET